MSTKVTSANLTATTCDTPPASDNSQSVVNSAWAKFGFAVSLLPTGYIKLPTWLSGLILQWGVVNSDINGGTLPVTFGLAFPNSAFAVLPVTKSTTDRITYVVNNSLTQTGFTIGNNGSSGFAYWFAVGY